MDTTAAAFGLPTEAPYGLWGTWAKLRGANRHLIALRAAVDAYLGHKPYRTEETPEADGRVVVRRRVWLPPPLAIGVIFGDVLHCCASALDHAAWAFARTVQDPPHPKTEWPIYASPEMFAERRNSSTRDIPPPVLEALEEMQPYQPHDSVGAELGRQLLLLRTLSNDDKHRVLPVVATLTGPRAVAFDGASSDVEWIDFDGEMYHGLRLPPGAQDGRVLIEQFWHEVVTIRRDDLPWRSGIAGIAEMLVRDAEAAIAALRTYWEVLRSLPEDSSAWWAGG